MIKRFIKMEKSGLPEFPEYNTPRGFYFGLRVPIEGEYWKLDIWYLQPDEAYTQLVMTSLDRFETALDRHPAKAKTVLGIKQDYFDGTKYRDGVKSIDIYRAVFA